MSAHNVTIKELRAGDYDTREEVQLSAEEMAAERELLEKKKKAIDELLRKECVGKYKIEIFFSRKRSITNPTAGALSIWESGSKLHGGGDGKVYFCPGSILHKNDCDALIPFDNVNYGHALCPRCKLVWTSEQLRGEVLGNWTMQTWAKKVDEYYRALWCSADVYVKQPRVDIREAAALEQQKQMHGDRLTVARSAVIRYIYPLARILKDTANGTDTFNRFYAFLKS